MTQAQSATRAAALPPAFAWATSSHRLSCCRRCCAALKTGNPPPRDMGGCLGSAGAHPSTTTPAPPASPAGRSPSSTPNPALRAQREERPGMVCAASAAATATHPKDQPEDTSWLSVTSPGTCCPVRYFLPPDKKIQLH